MVRLVKLIAVVSLLAAAACSGPHRHAPERFPPTPRPAPASAPSLSRQAKERIAAIARILRPGVMGDEVYTVSYTRQDLILVSELGDVPPEAGLESTFHFMLCRKCEAITILGQFCVIDFEANDVIDELRAAHLRVASVAPLMVGERPRLLLIRFQGEGKAETLANALKKALAWTGEARLKGRKPSE